MRSGVERGSTAVQVRLGATIHIESRQRNARSERLMPLKMSLGRDYVSRTEPIPSLRDPANKHGAIRPIARASQTPDHSILREIEDLRLP
jgi:hypothetical protein